MKRRCLGPRLNDLGLSPDEIASYARRVDAVTPQSVAAAAQSLKPENATLIVVGDAAKFIDKLRTLRSNVELIKVDDLDWESIRVK